MKIVLKKLIFFTAFVGMVFQLSSCYRTNYKFIHHASEITSIEIVENRYIIEKNTLKDYQNVLVAIEDTDKFLNDFESIPYTMPLYNGMVLSFGYSEIGIKFIYSNGDYEILSSGVYKLVYKGENGYDHAVDGIIGFFDQEQFDTLLDNYLSEYKTPTFFLMNDSDMISSIEIIDGYMHESTDGRLEFTYNFIVKIENVDYFLNELHDLKYSYTLQQRKNGQVLDNNQHRNVIKITYTNGDYEIFDKNWRDIYVKEIDKYFNDAYIGEFDEEAFDSLIGKYSQ